MNDDSRWAKGLTPRQATHRQGGYAPAFLAGFDQVVTVKVSLATAKRIGKYDNMVNQLLRGRISERQFDRQTAPVGTGRSPDRLRNPRGQVPLRRRSHG